MGRGRKAALYHPLRPWAFKNATVISNAGPDYLEETQRKDSSPERSRKELCVGWMKERVSEYVQSHTRKRDMAKEIGEWKKGRRENKSSFPRGIDWHLHRELAFSTKATSILSKVGLFRECSLFLVYWTNPSTLPSSKTAMHPSLLFPSFPLLVLVFKGCLVYVKTDVDGTNGLLAIK